MKHLYKVFLIVLILLGAYSQTYATEITVSSQAVPNVQSTVTTLRIFCNRAFITGGSTGAGKPIQQGSPEDGIFYLSVPVSMSGTTATISSFTIDSTTNGRNFTGARYSAYFYDADGNKVAAYQPFTNFAVPPSFDTGTTASWTQIAVFNTSGVPIFTDLSTYSRTEIDAKLAAVNGLTNPLTTLGDIIVAGSGGSLMRLPGNLTTTKQFYSSMGTGSAANQVALGALTSSDITTALTYTPINKAGDTMTGALTLSGAPTQNLHAATKLYVDTMMGGMGTIQSINGSSTAAQTLTVNATTFPTLTITDNAGDHKFGLSGPIGAGQGGTGLSSYTAGDIPYATGATTIAKLAIGANNTVLKSNGSAPVYGLVDLTANVTGILPAGGGGTGNAFFAVAGPATSIKTFTFPNASATVLTTNAAVTAVQGGTGQTSYTVGQILYADTITTLAKLNIGTANQVLHGGTIPSYSAVDIVNDTTGILTVGKGGTGVTSITSGAYIKGAGASAFTAQTTPLPIADLIASPTTNGVVYNGAGALAVTSAGATGTVLIGTTSSAPSFSAAPIVTSIALTGLTTDSIPFVGAAGLISQNNARLAWDNTNFRLNIQGTLRLKGSNAGQTGFIAPATVTGGGGTVIYVLPAADGTNGQALVTDGSGNLSWVTLSGGGGSGITSLNGLTAAIQALTITTSGANSPSITQPTSSQNQIIIPLAGNSVTAGLLSNASQTLYGAKSLNDTLSLRSGTTTDAPLIFNCSSCAVLTTPVAGAFETNGTNLFYTQSIPSTVRKTISFTDTAINDSQLSANVQLKSEKDQNSGYAGLNSSGFVPLARGGTGIGLTIGAAGTVLRSDGTQLAFSTDGSALTSLNASNISSGTLSNSRLSGVELTANKGVADGYASLNGSTKVPVGQISEVLAIADTTTFNGVSGSGTTAIAATITTPADGQYLAYNNSTNNWENRNLPSSQVHNLLDGTTHPDTVAATVTRGALIVGNATPKWDKLSLGSANQSLTSNGTDAVWALVDINNGTSGTLAASRGGTGVDNGTKTITLGGSFTTSGAFTTTLTTTANTSITLPTTGTVATLAGSETFSNKQFSGGTNFLSIPFNGNRYTPSSDANDAIINVTNAANSVNWFTVNNNGQITMNGSGNVYIGSTTGGAKLQVTKTTEQFRPAYDVSNYCSFTVSSVGLLTLSPAGSGAAVSVDGKFSAKSLSSTAFNAGNSGTALTINWNNGQHQYTTLTGNVTLTLSNPVAGTVYMVTFIQDATGGRTVTFPAAVKTSGGGALAITSTANKKTVVMLYYGFDGGTDYAAVLYTNDL